jgi:hypothetical protein
MADEIFEIGFETVGDQQAVQTINRVQQATRGATQAGVAQAQSAAQQAQRIVQSQVQVGAAVQQTGQRWGQAASALGNVGAVVGTLSPRFASLGSVIGQVGGATSALSGAMGPVGVIMAGATAAAAAYSLVLEATRDRTEENAEATRGWIERLIDVETRVARAQRAFSEMVRGASAARLVEEQDRLREEAEIVDRETERARRAAERMERTSGLGRLAMGAVGGLTGEDTSAELAERLPELERRAQELTRQLSEVDVGLTRAVVREEQERVEAAEAEVERLRRRRSGGGGADRAAEQEREQANRVAEALERLAAAQKDIDAERLESHLTRLERQEEAERQYYARMGELSAQAAADEEARQAEAAGAAARRQLAQFESNLDARQEAHRTAVDQSRATEQQSLRTVLDLTTDATGQMISFVQKGGQLGSEAFMAMLDSFLETTSIQYTIKALAEVAEAVMAAARYDYAAAGQHAAGAGLAAAVAAATGIAGAAISVPSASTGAGPSPAPVGAGEGGNGGGNVTVNLFAPQAVFTEAERGQILASGLRAARRELGPAAVRT